MRLPLLHFAVISLALFPFAPGQAGAEDHVWSALIFATNAEPAKTLPVELTGFKAKLEDIFGYRQFEVIDSHTELMDDPSERWLLPSKHFSLRVAAWPIAKSLYDVKLELFHEKKRLVQTAAKLGSATPLFIRGPLCGTGQLIFVLVIRQAGAGPVAATRAKSKEIIPVKVEIAPKVTGSRGEAVGSPALRGSGTATAAQP